MWIKKKQKENISLFCEACYLVFNYLPHFKLILGITHAPVSTMLVLLPIPIPVPSERPTGTTTSGKNGKPDNWFLSDLYQHKQNLVAKVQEPVPEMSHISHQTYKILHRNNK